MNGPAEFKRILVPIDFSDGSRGALDRAAALVKATQGELLLLHVVEPAVIPTVFAELSLAALDLTDWTERAERLLGLLEDEQRAQGLRVRSLVHPGYPSRDIIDTARAEGVDLIVIGSSGHKAATHAFFGSTVERVVRKAHCPVLVTRPKPAATKTSA